MLCRTSLSLLPPPLLTLLMLIPVCQGFSNMADTQSVAILIDSTTSKIQQLQQAFAELESHNAVSLNLKWKELEEHFHGLENSLKTRFVELQDQEKEYETKVMETQEMLEKQEAVVVAKEQATLEQLQGKRDAALSDIGYVFGKYRVLPPVSMKDVSNGVPDTMIEEKLDVKPVSLNSDEVIVKEDNNPQSELMKLCENMDSKGLHKFISDNRKNLASIREEIPIALRNAADPFALVLDSLKDFYSGEILGLDGKKDASLLGLRRTCLMLMESLGSLMEDTVSDYPYNKILTSDIRQQAKLIANDWKPKLNDLDIDANNGNSLEAHAFLQLLATFGIASEFDEGEICKLIPAVSRRRQTADLCRSLGLTQKMPGWSWLILSSSFLVIQWCAYNI